MVCMIVMVVVWRPTFDPMGLLLVNMWRDGDDPGEGKKMRR